MTRYRKKPVTVEAMRFMGDIESFNAAAEFTGQSFDPDRASTLIFNGMFPIKKPDGILLAVDGDWIVKPTKDGCFPCKPDEFAETYEEVRDD